jgi:hypothetical protein
MLTFLKLMLRRSYFGRSFDVSRNDRAEDGFAPKGRNRLSQSALVLVTSFLVAPKIA